MIKEILEYARGHHEAYLKALEDYLRIPSISALPEHSGDVQRAADWTAMALREAGFVGVRQLQKGGHPAVYAEWLGAGEAAPTLLVYGHYDVQPVDPLEEWKSPPFQPERRGEDLYARGASDDKGQVFALICGAGAYLKTAGNLPINMKFLIEGEEEISSPSMKAIVEEERERLAADAILISDEQIISNQHPTIFYGLRGNLYLEVEARGPTQDLHSGTYGGAVDNPINALVRILAQLHDPQEGVKIPGFYDQVQPLEEAERELISRNPTDEVMLQRQTGAPALIGERGYSVEERRSVRPTFEIHGIRGGYTGEGKKTVIPAWAAAKVSMRLVPNQDPVKIQKLFESYVKQIAPPTVEISIRTLGMGKPVLIDYTHPAVQAAAQVYRETFNAEPVYVRGGGTISIISTLQDALQAPIVMIGIGLPDDNLHAPNEKLHIPNFYRGIELMARYIDKFKDVKCILLPRAR